MKATTLSPENHAFTSCHVNTVTGGSGGHSEKVQPPEIQALQPPDRNVSQWALAQHPRPTTHLYCCPPLPLCLWVLNMQSIIILKIQNNGKNLRLYRENISNYKASESL